MSFIFLFFFFLASLHAQQPGTPDTPELEINDATYRNDNLLCGPNSLSIVCKLLDVEAQRDELARIAGMNERGTTLYGLKKAAVQKGLYAVGVETTLPQLQKLPPPMIVQVLPEHFLVVNGFEGDWVYIIDAPEKPYALSLTDFEKIWTGKALIISQEKVKIGFSSFRYIIIAFGGIFLVSVFCIIIFWKRNKSLLPRGGREK